MRKPKLVLVQLIAGIAACAQFSIHGSWAQGFPNKPIHIIVGGTAGSATDASARVLGPGLSESLGQPVVIDNRSGAAGAIATETVAKATADGYTLHLMSAGDAIQPALRAKVPYDLERDFAPVSMMGSGTGVLVVHPSVPAHNIKELIALARSQPGKLNYGSSGIGSSSHLMGELFNLMGEVKMVHVPYKGGPENVIGIVSGQIESGYPSLAAAVPLLKIGRLRALAITSAKRSSLMPSIPTMSEAGLPGYDRRSWFGIAGPAGMPRDVITRLNAAIVKVVNTPEVQTAYNKLSVDPQTTTPEQFAAFIRNEIAQNIKLIKLSGAKAE